MSKIKLNLELFWSFFKIGGMTFGGGLTMLPMLEHELVQKKEWVSEEELLDCYAIGQCTPGIIAVNTATFVGYKKNKISGGIFATLGMIFPSILIITIIAMFLKNFMDNIWFQHALQGVRGVVCALLCNTVINLCKKSLKNLFTELVFLAVLLLGFFTKIPTIILVLLAAAAGIIADLIKEKTEHLRRQEGENE
ncbi:MAG: chromate transporter [Treponema sp.]|nr:chromate transporter [Treponema sp.]MDY3130165.1 chromate transporter [Treponema sp.]